MLDFNFNEIISLVITPILIGLGIYFGRIIHNIYKEKAGVIFEDEIINIKTVKEFLSEIRVSSDALKVGLYQFINGNKFITGKSVYKTILTSHSVKAENIELEYKLGFKTREFTINLIPSILKEVNDNKFIFCRFDLIGDHSDEIYYLGGNSNVISYVGKIGTEENEEFYGILVIHIPVENIKDYENIIQVHKKYNLKITELIKKTEQDSFGNKFKRLIFKKGVKTDE